MRAQEAVGFALAGGRSLRLGRDKALLPWEPTDLLGHALARLREAVPEVAILCGPGRRYEDRGVGVVSDRLLDVGPVAGLLAGLEAAGERPGLFLAVDLPLVPPALLRELLRLLPGFDAVVPATARGREPLCAAYGPACLEPARARVRAGECGMKAFWPDVRVREVAPAELQAFGDPATLFLNVNDHEAAALARSFRGAPSDRATRNPP